MGAGQRLTDKQEFTRTDVIPARKENAEIAAGGLWGRHGPQSSQDFALRLAQDAERRRIAKEERAARKAGVIRKNTAALKTYSEHVSAMKAQYDDAVKRRKDTQGQLWKASPLPDENREEYLNRKRQLAQTEKKLNAMEQEAAREFNKAKAAHEAKKKELERGGKAVNAASASSSALDAFARAIREAPERR